MSNQIPVIEAAGIAPGFAGDTSCAFFSIEDLFENALQVVIFDYIQECRFAVVRSSVTYSVDNSISI